MKRSAYLIHNPVAGQGNSDAELKRICKLLQTEIDLDIRLTTKEVDADQLACTALKEGASMIIVSGGDGSVSAVTKAVLNTGIPIGVIPRGTANAFARAIGIPIKLEAACQTILEGHTRVVDAARCNYFVNGAASQLPIALLATIGFGAKAVKNAKRSTKSRFGVLAYVLAWVRQLWQMELFETRVETEDEVVTINAAAVTVANVAPPTSLLAQGTARVIGDDGMLDITIVAPAVIAGAIAAGLHLLLFAWRRTAVERPDIVCLRAKLVKVTTEPPQIVALDGEIVGITPVEILSIPSGLTVLVPQQLADKA